MLKAANKQSPGTMQRNLLTYELSRLNVRQQDIAAELNVSPGTVSKALAGTRTGPDAQRVRKFVARTLRRPMHKLFKDV